MSRTEADQREYLLAACDCLEAGNLEAFRKLRTQWRAGGSITALRSQLLTAPLAMGGDSIDQPTGILFGEHQSHDPDRWTDAWVRLEAIWNNFDSMGEGQAAAELERLAREPWTQVTRLAHRCQLALAARVWIGKAWPRTGRRELLDCFYSVLLKPPHRAVNDRSALQQECGTTLGFEHEFAIFCRRFQGAFPELSAIASESLEQLLRHKETVRTVVPNRSRVSWPIIWSLIALCCAPFVRILLMAIAIDPVAVRRPVASSVIGPANQPQPVPRPKTVPSVTKPDIPPMRPRFPEDLEDELEAFSQLCDLQDSSDPEEARAAQRKLLLMRQSEPSRYYQFAVERGKRLVRPATPPNLPDGSPAPATNDELRKLHMLRMWTERDRQKGRTDSLGESELRLYLRTLGPRLSIVLAEYRRRLEENPRAFPGADTLGADFGIPAFEAVPSTPRRSETSP